jgi:DNA-binding NtrC family response regulator
VARSGAPLLITGETGTGKELCARAVHHLSCRRDFPFIPVDCSAMPDQLFENEVFGHVRGAFTDAHSEQKGLVAMAEKGTLFLDEIDSLSLPAQAKLLRFLQERAYKPLGADRFVRADVHVMTATNQDLEPSVQDGRFRRDLYFRLNVIELQLPPLRERRTDVELLANHFIRSFTAPETGGKRLSAAALRKLVLHEWPGNVRELSNVIQRAFVFCESAQILPWHISFPGTATASDVLEEDFRRARRRAVESFERGFVEESLRKHHGNVTRAALDAGKDRRAFGRLVKKYRIDRGEFEPGGH